MNEGGELTTEKNILDVIDYRGERIIFTEKKMERKVHDASRIIR
jgi:hypothetical protein